MKYCLDLTVNGVERPNERYVLLRLTHSELLPPMLPGQFVEVRIDGKPSVFLRRPISICMVDQEHNELWLLVAVVGEGTRWMSQLNPGDKLNCLLPLGRGFSLPTSIRGRHLLVGGGVGVAPLLYLGKVLSEMGSEPTFLLGAKTANDLLMYDEFRKFGRVFVTTEDGSMGERGFVTHHSLLAAEHFDKICCCGPKPMMVAVTHYAEKAEIDCEVSLENMMACGLGACLCCVEKTTQGNLCVCKEGPVFNTKMLPWQN